MIISDFHTHTEFSDDCRAPFYDSINLAIDRGIEILAITDHHDPGYPSVEVPFHLNFDQYFATLDKAREIWPKNIAAGIEIGIMEGELEESNRVVNSYDFDVVIGSFHCYKDLDISSYEYTDENLKNDGYAENRTDFIKNFYEYVYGCLRDFNNYDILGHINFIDRYMGGFLDYSEAGDTIDEILKLIIDNGKALEINTSTFRYKLDTWFPRESMLRRYRELGGEMITFGSDAHSAGYYRDHFDDAIGFAKSLGFKYQCIYKNRVPQMDTL